MSDDRGQGRVRGRQVPHHPPLTPPSQPPSDAPCRRRTNVDRRPLPAASRRPATPADRATSVVPGPATQTAALLLTHWPLGARSSSRQVDQTRRSLSDPQPVLLIFFVLLVPIACLLLPPFFTTLPSPLCCRPGGHVRLRRASLERRRLPVGRSGTRPASPPSAHHPHHMPARLNRPSEERQAGPAEGQVQTAVVIAAPRRRSVSPDPFGRVG